MKKAYKFFLVVLENFILFILRIYKKYISPILPHACRYTPTCSEYMIQAIQVYGVWKGGYLGIKRLLRCHPFGKSGYDPVPKPKFKHTKAD